MAGGLGPLVRHHCIIPLWVHDPKFSLNVFRQDDDPLLDLGGLFRNANLRRATHSKYSIRLEVSCQFNMWMLSHSIRKFIPLHSVSRHLIILNSRRPQRLSFRIYTLTGSRLRSELTMAFSGTAFVLGLVSSITSWIQTSRSSLISLLDIESLSASANTLATTWLGLRAISECLIMSTSPSLLVRPDVISYIAFLTRALLSSRTGLRKSNTVIRYLVRSVIQIGVLASLWAIGGLVTWFFLPKRSIYTVFNLTAGSMYTNVSGSLKIVLRSTMMAPR